MIGPLQWQQIGELFHAARERPVGDRFAFIAAGCGGDEEIRREVNALLALQTAAAGFLEHPALGPGSGADSRLAGWTHLSPFGDRRDRNRDSDRLQTWAPDAEIPIQMLELPSGRVRVLGSVKMPFESVEPAVSPTERRYWSIGQLSFLI
jgi:hypothetical protein